MLLRSFYGNNNTYKIVLKLQVAYKDNNGVFQLIQKLQLFLVISKVLRDTLSSSKDVKIQLLCTELAFKKKQKKKTHRGALYFLGDRKLVRRFFV